MATRNPTNKERVDILNEFQFRYENDSSEFWRRILDVQFEDLKRELCFKAFRKWGCYTMDSGFFCYLNMIDCILNDPSTPFVCLTNLFFVLCYLFQFHQNELFKLQVRDHCLRRFTVNTFVETARFNLENWNEIVLLFHQTVESNQTFLNWCSQQTSETIFQIFNEITRLNTSVPPQTLLPPMRVHHTHKGKQLTVYEWEENVHTTALNNSSVNAMRKLIKKYQPKDKTSNEPVTNNLADSKTLSADRTSVHPIELELDMDLSFIQDMMVRGIKVTDLLLAVFSFINQHPSKEELLKRLKEELLEGSDKCSTGVATRIVNSIQGFTENDSFSIRISEEESLLAKFKWCIEKTALENNVDPIVNPDNFKTIIINVVTQQLDKNSEWITEMLSYYGYEV